MKTKAIAGRKGFADGITNTIVSVGIGVIVIAVIAIMLGAFQSDLTVNSSEYNVTAQGLGFLTNATEKFDTAGTIVGVLVLLAVIGGGAFLGAKGLRSIRN